MLAAHARVMQPLKGPSSVMRHSNAAAGHNQAGNPNSQYRKPKQIRKPELKTKKLRWRQNYSHGPQADSHYWACMLQNVPSSVLPRFCQGYFCDSNLCGTFGLSVFGLSVFGFGACSHVLRQGIHSSPSCVAPQPVCVAAAFAARNRDVIVTATELYIRQSEMDGQTPTAGNRKYKSFARAHTQIEVVLSARVDVGRWSLVDA